MFDLTALEKAIEGIYKQMIIQTWLLQIIVALLVLVILVIWLDGRKLRKYFKDK